MTKVTVSAPGKLMLFGEHSVVYGYPCLVTAVDTRMRVVAEKTENGADIIITPQVKESKFVKESIKLFKKEFNIGSFVTIHTRGDFSHQVGLGSSSAVTVATFKALSILFKIPLSNKEIFNLAYKVTIGIQRVGSGFDIGAATYGKTLYYVHGGKKIESLKTEKLALVVGYSGIKADTPMLIKKVFKNYQKQKEKMKDIFEQITKIVKEAKKDIIEKRYNHLGFLMTENHILLQKLGVSTAKLDQMVEASLKAGALGAKLSGAGGGDCMIALVSPNNYEEVKKVLVSVGGTIVKVNNNAEGVRTES